MFYSSKHIPTESHKNIYFDIKDESSWNNISLNKSDKLILLTWRNLPNHNEAFHITENLTDSLKFISYILNKGIKKIVIAGTCYEYGLQNGMLAESIETKPINCYAIAKDSLRKLTQSLCNYHKVDFAWLRIFFVYGEGQHPKSLIPSLDKAILNKDKGFDISQGDQIRDFIKVDKVAKLFLKITDSSEANGIYNIGSGEPISILDFLENYINEMQSDIKLNRGVYPRRKDEPLAFWADTTKLESLTV